MSKSKLKKKESSGLARSERSERSAKPDDLRSKSKSSRVETSAARRRIDRSFKIKTIEELDALHRGEKGLYLRKMGLYSSQVSVWRKEIRSNEKEALMTPREEIIFLKKENDKLKDRNESLEDLIDLQKKIAKILKIKGHFEEKQ